ncbi:hypothetical protein BC938DRAFT_473183 [Jimgerdemannia flammicorona]|uniref:Ion transport domain-containing protein n=1 Tax=Jimgerdemannia flammicorona TaxID=994334 RepID=A0A433QTG8_9FUNG|nr:hypothetical protein BC938DRAFT_473183 [Jimgerdemannia flammicorona]
MSNNVVISMFNIAEEVYELEETASDTMSNNNVVIPIEEEVHELEETVADVCPSPLYRIYAGDYESNAECDDTGTNAIAIHDFQGGSWSLQDDPTRNLLVKGYIHGVRPGTYQLVASIQTNTDNRPAPDLPGGLTFLVEPHRKTDPSNKSGKISHLYYENIFKDNNGKGWIEYILSDYVYIEPCYGGVDVDIAILNTNGYYKRNIAFDYVELRPLLKHQRKSASKIQQVLPPHAIATEDTASGVSQVDPAILSLFEPKESYKIFFADAEKFDVCKQVAAYKQKRAGFGSSQPDEDADHIPDFRIIDHHESEFGKVVYMHCARGWDFAGRLRYIVAGNYDVVWRMKLDADSFVGTDWFEWTMPQPLKLEPTLGWSAVTIRIRKGHDRHDYNGLHFDWVELRPRSKDKEIEDHVGVEESTSSDHNLKITETPHQAPIDHISLSGTGVYLVSLSRQDGRVTVWLVHDDSLEKHTEWKFDAIANLNVNTPHAAISVAIRDDARFLVAYEEPVPRSKDVMESSDSHPALLPCTVYSIDSTLTKPQKIIELPYISHLSGYGKFVHPEVQLAEIQASTQSTGVTLQDANSDFQITVVQQVNENFRTRALRPEQLPLDTAGKFLFSTTDYLYVFDATTWKLDHRIDLRNFAVWDPISKYTTTNIMINSATNSSMIRLESENIASIFSVQSGHMKMRLQSAEGYKHMGSTFNGYSKMAISTSGDLAVIAGIRGKLTVFDARTGLRLGETVEKDGDINYVGFADTEDRIVTFIRRADGDDKNKPEVIEAQIRDVYNDCQVIATTLCDAVPVFGRVIFSREMIIAIDGFDIAISTVNLSTTVSKNVRCIAEHPSGAPDYDDSNEPFIYTTPMQNKNGDVVIDIKAVAEELSNSELKYWKHFVFIKVRGQPDVELYPEPWMRSPIDNQRGRGELLSAYLLEDGKRLLVIGCNTIQVWKTSPLSLQYIWSTPFVKSPEDSETDDTNSFKGKKLRKENQRQRLISAVVLVNVTGDVKLRLRCAEGKETLSDHPFSMHIQYELALPGPGDRCSHFIVDHLFEAVDLLAAMLQSNCAVQLEAVVEFCGYYASRINNFIRHGSGVTLIGKLIQENSDLDPLLNNLAEKILEKNTYLPRCHHSRLPSESTSLALAIKCRNTYMVTALMKYFQRFHNEKGGHTDAAYMVLVSASISDLCSTYPFLVTEMLHRVSYLPSKMEHFVNDNGEVFTHFGPTVAKNLKPIFMNDQLRVKRPLSLFDLANSSIFSALSTFSRGKKEENISLGLPLRVCLVPLADFCIYPPEKQSFWDTWIKPRSPFSREALSGRNPLDAYAKYYVYLNLFLYVCYCILVSVGIHLATNSSAAVNPIMCASIAIGCFFLLQEFRQILTEPLAYVSSVYNYLDLCAFTFPIATCTYVLIQMMQMRVFKKFGPLIYTVIEICKKIIWLLVLIAFFVFGFTHALYYLVKSFPEENDKGPNGYNQSVLTAIKSTYFFIASDYSSIAPFDGKPAVDWLKAVFFFLMGILLLNLLISFMGDTISDTKETGHKAWLGQLASVIAEVEVFMLTPAQRQHSHWFPSYMYYYATADTVNEWMEKFRPQPEIATQPAIEDLKAQLMEMKKTLKDGDLKSQLEEMKRTLRSLEGMLAKATGQNVIEE